MRFNKVLNFEFLGPCYYTLGPIRKPRRGEYYLSGAIVQAYKAYHDIDINYQIVTPTAHALPHSGFVRGQKIESKTNDPSMAL
jgi:hypothetical protein